MSTIREPGEQITNGQQITSPNGRYWLILQHDGNVVVYASGGRPIFATGSYGSTSLRLQRDGNLVAYAANGAARWATGTYRDGNSRMAVQDDGNVVLYRADGTPSWHTGWDTGRTATGPSNGYLVPRPGTPPPPPPPPPGPPANPGDSKNCPDFATQRDAQAWFDYYYPYYGDVARLDGNNDLVACEGLPR